MLMKVQEGMMHQLVLAVDEACANSIIHHHAEDGTSIIELTITKKGRELLIELKDNGEPFPINEYKPEDIKEIIKKRTRGGLGIFLITKIMDKIEVIERKDDFTYRFTKYL